MKLGYKKSHEDHHETSLPEGLVQRLFSLLFKYKVVPGVNWNGEFDASVFQSWINDALKWAKKEDRLTIVQQTIGQGLSYADKTDGLPDETIMNELNKQKNRDMRSGYRLGIINQRGVHFVDPEAKPEKELSEKYKHYAEVAQNKGYSRFAETLLSIAENYEKEAEEILKEQKELRTQSQMQ